MGGWHSSYEKHGGLAAPCAARQAAAESEARAEPEPPQREDATFQPPRLSVAPMMDWTDTHFRYLCRLLTRHTWLYTEMVVDATLVHVDRKMREHAAADAMDELPPHVSLERHLRYDVAEHPIVLQLGGSNPEQLAAAATIAERWRYDEINLNCGCPSDKVSGKGCFGAALMYEPQRVADICAQMSQATAARAPVTVKCRIGVDDRCTYDELVEFVETVSTRAPVRHFVIHARRALLDGLSPAENRKIPELKHEFVFALARHFPELRFTLNGGILGCHAAAAELARDNAGHPLHGVMIGRGAYKMPWLCLADADRAVFGQPNAARNRREVIEQYIQYGERVYGTYGTYKDGRPNPSLQTLACPLLGLFHGERCSKSFKRAMDAGLAKFRPTATGKKPKHAPAEPSAGVGANADANADGRSPFRVLVEDALKECPDDVLDAPPPCASDECIAKFMEAERPALRDLAELREAKAFQREPAPDERSVASA